MAQATHIIIQFQFLPCKPSKLTYCFQKRDFVAAPVYVPNGNIMAAMSAADYAQRMNYTKQSEIRSALFEWAVALTQRAFPNRLPKRAAAFNHFGPRL